MSRATFIEDDSLLDETSVTDDYFKFDHANNLLEGVVRDSKNRSIICLVGGFGSGKSTALHNIEQKAAAANPSEQWFTFDAWKYPERKDLWENFVLELARTIDKKTFKRIEDEVDGTQKDDLRSLIDTVGGIPGAGGVVGLKHFVRTSPATRTYQVQKILSGMLAKNLKAHNLVIVIEDIDRSGDAGIFFLETLKSYLGELDFADGNSIKVIVPVATKNFNNERHRDAYLKATDIVITFRHPIPELGRYLGQLFSKKYFDDIAIGQMCEFFGLLFRDYPQNMTPRLLKHILRSSDLLFGKMMENQLLPDPRIVIAIEASKHFENSPDSKVFYDMLRGRQVNVRPYKELLSAIYAKKSIQQVTKTDGIGGRTHIFSFEIREEESVPNGASVAQPWYTPGNSFVDSPAGYCVSAFYFDY